MLKKSLILIFLLSSSQLFASIKSEVERIAKSDLGKNDILGLSIIHKDNETLSINGEKSFIPASTFKILASYYILEKLGADYRFKTILGYRGKIEKGVLNGDLILSASGDPYLLPSDLYNLALSLREKGVKKITGELIINSDFPNLNRIGNVGLDDQPYNQGLSPLNINFNRFKAIRRNGRAEYFPKLDYLVNKPVKALGPGEIFRRQNSQDQEVWQSAPLEKYFYEVPIRNTLHFNAHYFIKVLNELDIEVTQAPNINPNINKQVDTITLTSIESLPVIKLIELAMEYSNNLFIETLALKASKTTSLKQAASALRDFYKKNFNELNIHKLNFSNNSGLDLDLRVKPQTLASFLQAVSYKKFNQRYFVTLLSLAGNAGFLAKKFLHEETHLKFYAKTGSLDYVNGICGHVLKSQKSFCLYINNFKLRSELEGKNSKRKDQLRQAAKSWKRKTDQVLERIILKLFFSKNGLL